jgi:hypothetical protein
MELGTWFWVWFFLRKSGADSEKSDLVLVLFLLTASRTYLILDPGWEWQVLELGGNQLFSFDLECNQIQTQGLIPKWYEN